MKSVDNIVSAVARKGDAREKKRFIRSLEETAARAVVTATVTFAVGWFLKKALEKSVTEAAEEGVKSATQDSVP